MKQKIKKFIMMSGIMFMMTLSLTVYAQSLSGSSLGHKGDKWEYGVSFALNGKKAQYSEFYCKKEEHHATARVRINANLQLIEDKATAKAGKWAKAKTDYFKDVRQWNSYYSH